MQNFVRNSFNVRDQKTLSQLWDAFSGATKKVCRSHKEGSQLRDCNRAVFSPVQNQASAVSTDRDKTVGEKQTLDAQAKQLTKTDSDDMEPVPKKKKKKHNETEEEPDTIDTGDIMITNGDTGVGDIGDDEVPKRKKKKQKIEPTANETDAVSVANAVEVEGDEPPVIKKVKKKKKQREEEIISDLPAAIEEGDDEDMQIAKKAKKKKRKHKESHSTEDSGDVHGKKRKYEAELDNGDIDVDGEEVPAKKYKRGRGLENGDDHGLELLSDGGSQTVIKKHKKKHKH